MDKLEISYYAEGHKSNGNKVTLADMNGHTFESFIVDERRWRHCDTPREQEALLLGVARRDFPEVNWEHAHYVEIKQE